MKNLFSILFLLALAGNAQAHSHPGIDSFTHAMEHLFFIQGLSMPYALGGTLILLVLAVIAVCWASRWRRPL
jgi:predicted membrane protein